MQRQGDGPAPVSSTLESVIDLLKWVSAMTDRVRGDLDVAGHDSASAALTMGRLLHMDAVLHRAVSMMCPHCAGHMNTYSDGRPVTSRVDLDDETAAVHVWHPDHRHPFNRRDEVGTVVTRGGVAKRVIVSAAGFLDTVTASESAAPQPQPRN